MLDQLTALAHPLLLRLPPEIAHEATLRALEAGLYPRQTVPDPANLALTLWGLRFANPVGVAAGFDKEARVPDAVLGMGCGFAEIGTVTPRPQPGNPQPRVFRLPRDRGVINRLGFNSTGHAPALERLKARRKGGILAINIGANKDQADRAADYVTGLEAFWDVATTFVVNISSPNTPGLRDLQAPAALDDLLGRVMARREALGASTGVSRPIIVKIAPDIAEEDVAPICGRLVAHKVDGIAVSNTTLTRAGLKDADIGREAGGLSGAPLFHRSTVMLARVHQETRGAVPLIGIGGISSGETALAKIEAGASLLQLYSALIFEGPGLIGRIKDHLARATALAGVANLQDLKGRKAAEWAARSLNG